MSLAIGIDLGGTHIYAALVSGTGEIRSALECPTPVAAGHGAVLATMFDMARALLARAEEPVLGIGLGIPGLVDVARGYSLFAGNLGWRDLPVVAPFQAAFDLPVSMDNDVRVGALAELYFGAGRGLQHFLFAALGTGIGAGIVLGGELYRGPYGTAGELGHIPIPGVEAACACGARGCLEAAASGTAIRRRTLAALQAERDGGTSCLRELQLEEVSARTLADAARAGDPLACQLWEEIGTDLGMGIWTYCNLLGPDAVIIGGGVSLAGDLLLEPARRTAAARLLPGVRERLRVLPAQLGDEAAVIGAAALVPGLVAASRRGKEVRRR